MIQLAVYDCSIIFPNSDDWKMRLSVCSRTLILFLSIESKYVDRYSKRNHDYKNEYYRSFKKEPDSSHIVIILKNIGSQFSNF